MKEPIVSAEEMARIDALCLQEGALEQDFIEAVGKNVATRLAALLPKKPHVTLLAGKGNNGSDAYSVGFHLKKLGFQVSAYSPYPLKDLKASCKKRCDLFVEAGGVFLKSHTEMRGVIVDGLFGTGFQGRIEGDVAEVVQAANLSGLSIYSLDIPSGLNGTTGVVASIAIQATHTFYLELPKVGFFLRNGWDHVGILEKISFGMDSQIVKKAKPVAYLLQKEEAYKLLPKSKRSRHKYERGYVLGIAGSSVFSGAALLSSHAALKAGAGIVRLFYPREMASFLSKAPVELISQEWDFKNLRPVLEEAKRGSAIFIGPGMGRKKTLQPVLKKLLSSLGPPCVLDADALYFLSQNPSWKLPSHTILTPHHGEMQRLFPFESPLDCGPYVKKRGVTLVLKGAPTWIFHPEHLPVVVAEGSPAMATAGSGDVLTGILAALLAQGLSPWESALLGVFLHGLAGEAAEKKLTAYSVLSSDLIACLPAAFFKLCEESFYKLSF